MRIRSYLALYIGGMGARARTSTTTSSRSYGFEAEAAEIQDLYLSGRRAEAVAAVPDELVQGVTLLGDPDGCAGGSPTSRPPA